MPQEKPVHEGLLIEERIATRGDAFEAGAMKLGPATLLTCPECRGAMVKVEDGSPVTRFRCHAGHAHTLRSLLADLDQSLDHSLWNVVRGIEERLIILRDLEQEAKARGDHEGLERYRGEISLAQERHRELRQLVLGGRA